MNLFQVLKPMQAVTLLQLLAFFLLTQGVFPQESLDSADKIYSAQYAAYQRAQSGSLIDALAASKDALKTGENRYGPTHPAVVPLLIDLATLYRIMGRYEESESSLKWALAIREKTLGKNDLLIVETLEHLASLYSDWGKWEEAEFMGKRALSLLAPKGTEKDLIKSKALLADIKLHLQKPLEALTLLNQCLDLQEKIDSPPLETIYLLAAQSQAYLVVKNNPKAESSLQRALTIARKNFSPESVELADATKKLGDFYFATGQVEKSKPLFELALKNYKRFVGVYYGFSVLPYVYRLAEAYQSVGDFAAAKDLLEKGLPASQESFGPRHPLVAITLLRLARAEKGLGEKKAAKKHLEESLGILETSFPPSLPLIQSLKSDLEK